MQIANDNARGWSKRAWFLAGILGGIWAGAAIMGYGNAINSGLDDSDLDGWHRSGLRIHTDYKTGLQYFATSNGGLYPRLDANGKQMRAQ